MRRREFITLLGGAAAAWPLAVVLMSLANLFGLRTTAAVTDWRASRVPTR